MNASKWAPPRQPRRGQPQDFPATAVKVVTACTRCTIREAQVCNTCLERVMAEGLPDGLRLAIRGAISHLQDGLEELLPGDQTSHDISQTVIVLERYLKA